MVIETVQHDGMGSAAKPTSKQGWLLLSLLTISALFWLLAWYGETVGSMVATWIHSETYAHGFLIVPISAWLVWQRRIVIQTLNPKPTFWFIVPLAAAGIIWLLGNLASVLVVQQYSLVFMILFVVATILGHQIVKELAFPLLYLLFAVPFGEILLPMLMEHTADFTVFALKMTGIPVYREGLFFTLPSGNWSVIEACSGLRYLIASLTLGFLYAYLTYQSLSRRLIFIALSIVVPIAANWMRAYMIVMIGHLSSMKLAVGVDHLIYGWIFFGIVMFLLFWVGSFWRESPHETLPDESSALGKFIAPPVWPHIIVAVLVSAVVVAMFPTLASRLQSGSHTQPALQAPDGLQGWKINDGSLAGWVPRYLNPTARLSQLYSNGPNRVELYIGYYRNQRQNAEMISSQNFLVHSVDKVWSSVSESLRALSANGNDFRIIETVIRGRDTRLLVWHWFWVDGIHTANPYWAKLLQARSQLLGRGDNSAVIVVSAQIKGDVNESAEQLRGFQTAMMQPLGEFLKNVK